MISLRKDYDDLSALMERMNEDEPVFILRGQDAVMPTVVEIWADLVEAEGGDPEMAQRVREFAEFARTWQSMNKNRVKIPDVPPSELRTRKELHDLLPP